MQQLAGWKGAESFKIFLSYFRKPLLPRIARKKRFRKLYPNRKQTRAARGGKDFEKFLIFWSGLRCLRVFNSRGSLKWIAREKQFRKSHSNLKGKRKKIRSSEWLPPTSMNAAASRLKRTGKSFKIFLSYFRKPLLPRIARKKRFRKLYSNRKEKRFFYSMFRVASAH